MPSINTEAVASKFTKLLPVSIRNGGGGEQEVKEVIRVTLSYPSSSMNPNKEITLRLTNDENPLFFYHLSVQEQDFPELKAQQGLLVDFNGFPNQLVTLLEKCESEEVGVGPKFVLVLKVGVASTVLDIVESNPFKYLCHLSLAISPGTDSEVKKFLADVTSGLKKDLSALKDRYQHLASSMESESIRTKEILGMKNEEIVQLRNELHAQANSLSTKHYQDMTQEKEKLMTLQRELADKFEIERNDMERRHGIATSAMEGRISALESENRDLLQIKYKNETSLQEASNKIKHCKDDINLLQQEITLLRKQNEKLDHDYHEKQRLSVNLHNAVSQLESDLREKQNALQKNHEKLLNLTETKKNLEDNTTAMISEVERVKNLNKSVTAEVLKANEIIKKLQDDIRALNTKSKLQSQVTKEQERVIMDSDKTIQEMQQKIDSLTSSLESKITEVENLTTQLEESESKVTALDDKIKSNENMISWLNKQLNEFQGLSNLNKFRQNLAMSANQLCPPISSLPNVNIQLDRPPPTSSAMVPPNISPSLPFTKSSEALPYRTGAGLAPLSAGANANQSNNVNTLPNGTPSWMHIYHSTSTPLDDDLTSRLEKISTNPTPGMNYNDLKSRFQDPFEVNTNTSKEGNGNGNGNGSSNPKANDNINARPPTWARGKQGRVTLEMGGVGAGPGGVGKGILRR